MKQEPVLLQHIEGYFSHDAPEPTPTSAPLPLADSHPELDMDVRAMLAYITRALPDATPTARALARVLHGIGSPGWPASQWSKHRDWGRRRDVAFEAVMARAAAVLQQVRGEACEGQSDG